MKYFIFSIDDGTIYDKKIIDVLNKYHFQGTFNLNTGLQDFVWYQGDRPVKRNNLNDVKDTYKGHEVASHSLTHPYLTMCPDEIVYKEVNEDIENLERIFNTKIETFGFPFEDFDDRCINIIKNIKDIKVIRVSEIDESFRFPHSLDKVKITTWDINKVLDLFDKFIKDEEAELFVFTFHAYDFEFADRYDILDELCKRIKKEDSISVIPMKDLFDVINNV